MARAVGLLAGRRKAKRSVHSRIKTSKFGPAKKSGLRGKTKATTTRAAKPARFDVRVSADLRDAVLRAAEIEGRSISDFMADALRDASQRVIADQDRTILTDADRAVFFEALLNPPEPSSHLKSAISRHRKLVGPA